MIKVKDGYGKLIGTTYQGSADHLLRSNGDTWAVHTGRNNEANKIVRTDSNGQLQVGWINTTSGNLGTANITRIYCSNDNYIRYKTPENFFSTLSNNGDNISITVASQNRTLVVGYSKVAGQLRSKGTISPQTGRTQSLGDVYSYHLNGSVSGGPTKYASVIGFGRGTSGTVEIAGEWTSGRGLWVRALRDTTDNWYAWDKVLTQATYTGITDSRYYTKTQADERFVNITGDIMTGELINSSANAYRLKQSNYGVILRNDNNSFLILLTNSGSPSGSYNSLRPFRIKLLDGRVTIGNGLSVTGTIVGSSTIQGTQLISTIANGTAPLKVTSKTVVTNLNSDLLDGYHETSFFRTRGSQTIASSIPTTTELSSNNNLSGNWNVTFPGASGHLVQFNTGSGNTRYMQFYSYYSGSLYWRNSTDSTLSTKSWKTIVDSANYTGIVLKIGTATKGSATLPIYLNAGTPTACSTTLGVSITGNAATANRIISHSISDTLANKTTPGYLYHAGGSNSVKDKPSGVDAFGVFTMQTASGQYGQLLMSSNTSTGLYWRTATSLNGGWKKILDSSNYTAYVNPANFVTSLGTNGNYVTWTKNGTTNNLTVPFATTSNVLNNLGNRTAISGTTVGQSGLRLYRVYNNGYPVTYGNVLNIGGSGYGELLFQWTGDSNPGHLYYRSKRDVASQAWSNWVTILDNNNYSSTLDGRYVTLTTNQTVSGIKTFSTQQKFTVATGTSPFTVSSTTVVGNLNADMVDGYHSSKLFRSFGGVSIDFNFSDDNNNNGLYYLHSSYTQSNKNGITYGSLMNFSSSASSWQIISGSDARLYYRNRWQSGGGGAWSAWKTIAYTSDIKDPANYYWANVRVSASSNSGTSPTFNTCYTSNWFRSTGSTGWYSQTYGGGWYMTDSTWIRTYGSKSVYQNTGQIRTDGYLVTNGGITVGATSPDNGTYKSHVTGNSWSSGYIRAGAGFYHNSVNSNSYVLLAGGSYKSLADFAKGNAGASNRGVYVTNGTVTAMTYYLNATVNSGASGKLAYYSGTNSIDDYTSTVGSSGTPIYLSSGVPTACTGVMVKYWASYTIHNYWGTSVTYSKNGGNYNFVTSTSRRDTGRYTIGTVYPSGQTWYTTLVWAVGSLNASSFNDSSKSLLYCTLLRGYNSGSTYYWYVNTADDASTNNGSFELFFLCF